MGALTTLDDHLVLPDLELSTLSGPDHHHRPWLLFQIGHDLVQVFLEVVVELRFFLCLFAELMGELHDLLLDKLGPLLCRFDLLIELHDFLMGLGVHIAPNPLHLIFMNLLNITNSLEDVSYVIYPPLLNL